MDLRELVKEVQPVQPHLHPIRQVESSVATAEFDLLKLREVVSFPFSMCL